MRYNVGRLRVRREKMQTKANEYNPEKAIGLWLKGSDYYVFKLGKYWRLSASFGPFGLFKTKKAAIETADKFVMLKNEETL